ncbi:MAG TPA: hypothetical protein VHK91_00460 [Flavisolibacter sp.]|jgi:hypothetical protein|nr:hypothetical protein [Flavisolibacter sp.]
MKKLFLLVSLSNLLLLSVWSYGHGTTRKLKLPAETGKCTTRATVAEEHLVLPNVLLFN